MNVADTLKRVRRPEQKAQDKRRIQFNFSCDSAVVLVLKSLAQRLGVPLCFLTEHCLQVGAAELAAILQQPGEKQRLFSHLVSDHLLVSVVIPDREPPILRILRMDAAHRLLRLVESPHLSRRQKLSAFSKMIGPVGPEPSEEDVGNKQVGIE